jgi:hypothetical protein
MLKQKTERICKNCDTIFPYIPRRILCVDCYKKLTNWTKQTEEVKFIDDE